MAKARIATFLSVTSISLTLILIGAFVMASINLHHWINVVRQKIEMEVFLNGGVDKKNIEEVKTRIINARGVKQITYVSSEEAARRFEKEFGENIYDVLSFNPFPPSFKQGKKNM